MATTQPAGTRPRGVARRQIAVLIAAAVLLGGAMASFVQFQIVSAQNQAWTNQRLDLKEDITRITNISRQASQGLEPDFRALTDLQQDFGGLIATFRDGDPSTGMRPLPEDFQPDVEEFLEVWQESQGDISAILDNATVYQGAATNLVMVLEGVGAVRRAYEEMPESQTVAMQLVRLERMASSVRTLTALTPDATETAETLSTLERAFVRAHRTLPGSPLVDQATREFAVVSTAIAAIANDAPALSQYQEATAGFLGTATSIITAGNAVEQSVIDTVAANQFDPRIAYALGIGGIALLVLFIILFLFDARRRVSEALERDARQQKAILELLDEITNLADGDLTVDVTVTEDFTGAIADSINYTVASMRSLVGTITDTSSELASAASSTADTARQMNQASERQAKEVANVTNAIVASSQQLQQVASRAEALAQDAQRSVQVAHNGAETVNRTIQNMTTLREQIQDTAKRIKRLGESSQEIGNIIEFINDIAEQTNTLALNASIQAAMAGEQGRGFAVVADEVQRLAERAGNATRQIENLVKTIQADTNEAIVSMERSTANVVQGAKSAEEAGQALNQIESSSNDLARLIQEISASARAQSAAATKIAGTMQVIRDIAVQTSGSAAQTAEAVGNLNTLSEKLRASVAGFKLPNQMAA
jgi:twitching motility protein PilJ